MLATAFVVLILPIELLLSITGIERSLLAFVADFLLRFRKLSVDDLDGAAFEAWIFDCSAEAHC